jgi:hypothetical protein
MSNNDFVVISFVQNRNVIRLIEMVNFVALDTWNAGRVEYPKREDFRAKVD